MTIRDLWYQRNKKSYNYLRYIAHQASCLALLDYMDHFERWEFKTF